MLTSATAIAFGTWVLTKIGEKGFDKITEKLLSIDEKNKFYKVVEITSKQLHVKYPDVLGNSIDYFFKHDEIFSQLINLLFVDSKVDLEIIEDKLDITTLPKNFVKEFIDTLKSNLLKDSDFSSLLSNKEIYIMCVGISNEINSILRVSNLSYEEISKIKDLLTVKVKEDFNINNFLDQYYRSAVNNLSQVNFIGLGVDMSVRKGKRKKIKDIFIKPNFLLSENSKKLLTKDKQLQGIFKNSQCSYSNLFNLPNKIIILGNPGSGKSFMIKSMVCSIMEKTKSEFKNKEILNYIPFRIELRKYLSYKKENNSGIINYLCSLLSSEYSVYNLLPSTLHDLFISNNIVLFFDGLDEIFNIVDKIEIKNDVENFHNIYRNLKSITTSRIIGYEEASLDPENFTELFILNFETKQVDEYVNKWYSIEESNKNIREKEVEDFLGKKNSLNKELISNPLLLSLIVILYRNNLKLPESKLEIYQSCTSTLVDKWDSSKGLVIELNDDVYKRKETIFADLAFWQYNELSSSNSEIKITYEKAKNVVGQTLLTKLKLADEFTVEDISEKFMTYASKRSIYFDNNFTHKTFLEYYTAFWIYSNIEKKHKAKERNKLILKYIDNPFWHIVLELFYNLIDKDQADNEIIDELIAIHELKSEQSINFYLNILPSIQNISNTTISKILLSSIVFLFNKENIQKQDLKSLKLSFTQFELLKNLFALPKFGKLILEAFYNFRSSLNSVEQIKHFYYLFFETINSDRKIKINEFSASRFIDNNDDLKTIYEDYNLYILYRIGFFHDEGFENNYLIELIELSKHFPVKNCFNRVMCKFQNLIYIPFFNICFREQFKDSEIHKIEENLISLNKSGYTSEDIIYHLIDESHYGYFSVDKHTFHKIEAILDRNVGIEIEAIIMLYLFRSCFNDIDFDPKGSQALKKSITQSSNQKIKLIFDELFEQKNNFDFINTFIKFYGYKFERISKYLERDDFEKIYEQK